MRHQSSPKYVGIIESFPVDSDSKSGKIKRAWIRGYSATQPITSPHF